MLKSMTENDIAKEIFDSAYHIHYTLGPGLYEIVYENILAHELVKKGLHVVRQKEIKVYWDDLIFEQGFKADLIVEDKVLIEIKAVEALHPNHFKQVNTYLKLTDIKLGLLINFNEKLIKYGFKRIVNGLEE
ncbi:GxxExxY protein [Arthrospiribacter ruber]|nr:GxxExxY protein [Arthrospiribacter ruber]